MEVVDNKNTPLKYVTHMSSVRSIQELAATPAPVRVAEN